MYAGYPALGERAKLERTQPLDWSRAQLSVAEAFSRMLGGTALSCTGVWVGVLWLSRILRRRPSGTDAVNGRRRGRAA